MLHGKYASVPLFLKGIAIVSITFALLFSARISIYCNTTRENQTEWKLMAILETR